MKVIGLAGGSGTGKSTIAAALTRRGGVHVDADRIAHELLAGDESVVSAVRSAFGAGVFGADGVVDRRLLGQRVFASETDRLRLNSIIHPAIRERCGQRVDEARRNGAPFAVIDAALLLTSNMPFRMDLVIALRCDPAVCLERLRARGHRTEAEIRARLESQKEIEKSFYKADAVVDTGRTLEDVLAEIGLLLDRALAGN